MQHFEELIKSTRSARYVEDNILSLQRSVDSLRTRVEAIKDQPEVTNKVLEVLGRSDKAIQLTRQRLILEGLQFERMTTRFGDVFNARDSQTFGWILGPPQTSVDTWESNEEADLEEEQEDAEDGQGVGQEEQQKDEGEED
jgi:hypothetical protein